MSEKNLTLAHLKEFNVFECKISSVHLHLCPNLNLHVLTSCIGPYSILEWVLQYIW